MSADWEALEQVTVTPSDLVTLADISRICQVGRSTVQQWADRRTQDFPAPVIETTQPRPVRLWSWTAVLRWLEEQSS